MSLRLWGGGNSNVTVSVNYTAGSTPNTTDILAVPTGNSGAVTITLTIDGTDRSVTATSISAAKGEVYAYNVTIDEDALSASIPVGTVLNYSYTGTVQEVTLPKGKYKLQCWGAQGGTSSSGSATGSKGGYAEGVLSLSSPTTLYVFVGGQGASSGDGGWNGGGGARGSTSYESGDTYGSSSYACGGGATDICTVTSDMTYSSKRNNRSSASLLSRCIVAGGGAGGSYRYTEVTTTSTSSHEEYVGGGSRDTEDTSGSSYHSYFYLSLTAGSKYKIYISGASSGMLWNWGYTKKQSISSGSTFTASADFDVMDVTTSPPNLANSIDIYEVTTDTNTSTSTSSGKSNGGQQGGGTSGCGQYPGTQTSAGSNGAFGFGANQTVSNYRYSGGAGGGGWYGGGSYYSDSSTGYVNYSGGGSGFVNTAANASSRPSGYTGLQLDSGTTTAGNASFPSTSGGSETGHSGNGYAKITRLE